MPARLIALSVLAALVVVAGCGGLAATPSGAPTGAPTDPPIAPTNAPTATASPSTAPPQRVEVTLTDSLTIEPTEMAIRAGVPVTFVVTNSGVVDHEFFLGDEQMQAEHAQEMADMGGMMGHDEENGIAVDPGETKELTYTFAAPGNWLAGCHVSGHYEAGMVATVTIKP